MKTIFDLQTGVVTLLCTAALAGLTACEADPVMQESGKLPDKGSIEEVHVMLCSSNSVENRVDVLLTEGGVMTKNFYLRQTQPAAAGYSLDAWCDASLLNDYDAGDEIERTLLPEANYEFPDGKTLDLSAATQRSELKRIKFSASGLAAGGICTTAYGRCTGRTGRGQDALLQRFGSPTLHRRIHPARRPRPVSSCSMSIRTIFSRCWRRTTSCGRKWHAARPWRGTVP